jgi:hypothetical protein
VCPCLKKWTWSQYTTTFSSGLLNNGFPVKDKIVAVLNWLSSVQWRLIGEWMYRSTYSWPRNSWRWVVSFTPLSLYFWENFPRYPLARRLGGLQNQPEGSREKKNNAPIGTRTPTRQSLSPYLAAIPTELSGPISRLHNVGFEYDGWIGKDLEGSGHHFHGGTEENH